MNTIPKGIAQTVGKLPPAPTTTDTGAETNESHDLYVRGASPVTVPLPPEIAAAKQAVMTIAAANTTRTDNVADVRSQLQPHLETLGTWFAENRPNNELELTQGTWKNLWYDDPDITAGPALLQLDRSKIWQVVDKDFYYNVSEASASFLGKDLRLQSYLRGNYSIIDPATAATEGQPRRNVISLEFDENRAWFGRLPSDISKAQLVDNVVSRDKLTFPVPGPKGVTGELWNLYVDKDLRVSLGIQNGESKSTDVDVYVLRRDQ